MSAGESWLKGAADSLTKMMRSKVSADKKRFHEGEFDLDLTYITDRVIGMFFTFKRFFFLFFFFY